MNIILDSREENPHKVNHNLFQVNNKGTIKYQSNYSCVFTVGFEHNYFHSALFLLLLVLLFANNGPLVLSH